MTLTVNTSTTISSDVMPASGVAVAYGADNITVTIATGALVLSPDSAGIVSSRSGSILVNVGNIVAPVAGAVSFSGSNGFIQNEAGRNVIGFYWGISISGSGETVNNYGNIIGLDTTGVHISSLSGSAVLFNRGDIYGRKIGVDLDGDDGGATTVTNEGTIRSDRKGIAVGSGHHPTIINSGTISGAATAIGAQGYGVIDLANTGRIVGNVSCAIGAVTSDDTIVNRGTIDGVVSLGKGDDSFDGAGGRSGAVNGGGGDDTLIGGKGRDELWGGNDRDVFTFVNVKQTGKGNSRDTIMDFGDVVGETIDLTAIDARQGSGNQDFKFIGDRPFHHKAGELRLFNTASDTALIEGDVNGDGKADFQIEVHGLGLPDKGDILGLL